jgi:hypothetical protein
VGKARGLVKQRLGEVELYTTFHEKSLEQVIEKLQLDWGHHKGVAFEVVFSYDFTEIFPYIYRPENDAEYERRQKQEAKQAAADAKAEMKRRERELKQLEKLKRKYENA